MFTQCTRNTNCKIKGIIYLITCKKCNFQYVGETGRTLKDRMMEHIRNVKNKKLNTKLVQHYNSEGHSYLDLSFKILDSYQSENSTKNIRMEKENFWIRLLNTAYPMGLNDQIKGYGNINESVSSLDKVSHPYWSFEIKLVNRKPNKNKKYNNNNLNITEFIESIINEPPYQARNKILELNNKNIKALINYVRGYNNLEYESILMLESLLATKHWKNLDKTQNEKKNWRENHTVTIDFLDKTMEKMNIAKIFNNSDFIDSFVEKPKNTSIIYKYTTKLSSKIFNYNSFLKNLQERDIGKILNESCNCDRYKSYIDTNHKHICTGNLSIIQNEDLKSLMLMGTNFRIQTYRMSKDILFSKIEETIIKHTNFLMNKYKTKKSKSQVLRTTIENFKNKFNKCYNEARNEYADKWNHNSKEYLNSLKENFIITPIDKATNNYAVICKKFYLSQIIKEINRENNTYTSSTHTETDILYKHKIKFKRFEHIHKQEKIEIPMIYSLPKMHKDPLKFRFITGAFSSSLKPASICLQKILTFLRNHYKNYIQCVAARNKRYGKPYWAICNTTEVTATLNKTSFINKKIFCADFASLFTNLPHKAVIQSLYKVIDTCFKNAGKQFINANKTVRYMEQNNEGALHLNEVKELVNDILHNSYIKFGSTIYRQSSGIPQGNNASPLIADLVLTQMEFEYITKNQNIEWNKLKAFRYMDDILIIYDKFINLEFLNDMYDHTLKLERTNEKDHETNFLDLTIRINEVGFSYELYNKTDSYNFHVNRLINQNSFIHSNVIKGTLCGEIKRIQRNCSTKEKFLKHYLHLLRYNIKFNINRDDCINMASKIIINNYYILKKFNITITEIRNSHKMIVSHTEAKI